MYCTSSRESRAAQQCTEADEARCFSAGRASQLSAVLGRPLVVEDAELMDLESVPAPTGGNGALRCSFRRGLSGSGLRVLVVGFNGSYGFGSAGNADAAFMNEALELCFAEQEPSALILDLSELEYEWGDMLESVLPGDNGECGAQAAALVVGPDCREGIRTLIFGVKAEDELDKLAWVHESVPNAWAYIEGRLRAAQQ